MVQHFLDQPRLQKTDPEWDRLVRASMKERKYFEDSADQPSHNPKWATNAGIARLVSPICLNLMWSIDLTIGILLD